ncbi:hypothetical protein A2U01_0085807, partial [Trifolium medium]|nr:hypothetical protein [Trifolium medium]
VFDLCDFICPAGFSGYATASDWCPLETYDSLREVNSGIHACDDQGSVSQ